MADLEIVFGDHWKDDVRYLSQLPFRPADSPLNLVEIRDIIDVIVDGANLTAEANEESIFGIVSQLLEALVSLSRGEVSKAIIEFPIEPIELTICADGEQLFLSVYLLDRARRVMVQDAAINTQEFTDVVLKAAEQLLTEVLAIDDRLMADPFLRSFSADLSALRRPGPLRLATRAEVSPMVAEGSTSSSVGLTIGYTFEEAGNLLRYTGESLFDLHALLASGRVEVELRGETITISNAFPVLVVHAMLRRVRELLNLLESPKTSYECTSSLHHLRFDVLTQESNWMVRLGAIDGPFIEVESKPADLLDAILSIAELVLDDVRSANPAMELNQRFLDLRQETRDLRGWYEDLSQTNKYLERPEEYLRNRAGMSPMTVDEESLGFAFPFESVRALYPTRKWMFEVPHIHYGAMTLTENRILVPTSEALIALDATSGECLWRAERREEIPLSSYAVAGEFALLSNERADIYLTRVEDGVDVGRLEGVSGNLLLDAAYYPNSDLGVMADFQGMITGFDTKDASVRWQYLTGHGYLTGLVFEGPIVCALSSPGFIQALAPDTGELLWKVKLGGVAEAGPYAYQGRFYAISHDVVSQNLEVHAFHPHTGRASWHLRLEGALVGKPDFLGDWLILPIEKHGRIQLLGVDIESPEPSVKWTIELTTAGLDPPTRVISAEIDGSLHGMVRTDRSEIVCFKLSDGSVRWRIRPEDVGALLFRNLDMMVVRDSLLTVGETIEVRSLEDGRLLHSFGDVLEAPEYMRAIGSLSLLVGEPGRGKTLDQLICLELGHFLAVVP